MLRTWCIRGLALTLLTLCVVTWVGSYWQEAKIGKFRGTYNENNYVMSLVYGRVRYAATIYGTSTRSQWTWFTSLDRATRSPADELIRFRWNDFHLFGFVRQLHDEAETLKGRGEHVTLRGSSRLIAIPMWFPTFLSAALLWLLWRKTRPKFNGKGFPVEPSAKAIQ
jgi:hypothetical protein